MKAIRKSAVALLAAGTMVFASCGKQASAAGGETMAGKTDSVRAENIDDYAKKSMFPVGEPNSGFAQYFSGDTWLAPLNSEDAFIANVTFEPGAVNNWHVHHGEAQILIGVGGRGWVQFEGEAARPINEGDVVRIPPEVKHWHGAAKDSWFSHLSMSVRSGEGNGTDWLEPVDRGGYDALE